MQPEQFIQKYKGSETGHWASTPSLCFWAASYQMSPERLKEMSTDFLSIPGINNEFSSSLDLAHRTTKIWAIPSRRHDV